MHRHGWYLVAYDVASPRRLAKTYRILKNYGMALQKSVFIVHGTESAIEKLLDKLLSVMSAKEDDLRAYPIRKAGDLWTSGVNPLANFPLCHISEET